MQVSVESVGTLGRRLKVAVPAEQFEQAFADRIRRLSQKVKLPGFRPGKVPVKVVEAHYGGQVMHEVAGDLIQETFKQALVQHDLKPVGGPQIAHNALVRGQELEYTAEFEVYPEITSQDLKGVRIERPVVQIQESDIDRTIETMWQQRRTWGPVPRAARSGDRVVMDMTGFLDGKPIEGGSASDYAVVLGEGALVKDLETGLIDMQALETRRVSVTFPSDYRNAALAGKSTEFDVTVKEVAEPNVPKLDEEFVKQLGVADGKLETFRGSVRTSLEREAESRSRAVVHARALNALRDRYDFEVPRNLINAELARLKQAIQGSQPGTELSEEIEVELRKRASRRVALGLILAEIVRARDIKADAARVRARIEALAAEYESPENFIQWHYSSAERLKDVESQIIEETIVEGLLTSADISDKAIDFQELLKMDGSSL
jgi:trigger factor